MKTWLNWREIEKMNVWGLRSKDDAEAKTWDDGAEGWEKRSIAEGDAGQRQVDALKMITGDDTVLDLGCGTGPLTIPLAKRAKRVTAFDCGPNMIGYVREKAEREGLDNIDYLIGNWYTMEAGRDIPVHDIAVARHAPCQCDILKYSLFARKYCYSLWNAAGVQYIDYHDNPGVLSDPKINPNRKYNEPNGRLFGFNVHFNLLYELGANPTVTYVENNANGPMGKMKMKMSILGWDPSEIDFDKAKYYYNFK